MWTDGSVGRPGDDEIAIGAAGLHIEMSGRRRTFCTLRNRSSHAPRYFRQNYNSSGIGQNKRCHRIRFDRNEPFFQDQMPISTHLTISVQHSDFRQKFFFHFSAVASVAPIHNLSPPQS